MTLIKLFAGAAVGVGAAYLLICAISWLGNLVAGLPT